MPRDRLVLIYDALQATRLIPSFLKDKSFEVYDQDRLLQSAVERQFEIVGEALNVARTIDPLLDESIADLSRVVKNRNFLAHGYFAVINSKLWATAHDHLQLLIEELQAIIDHEPPPSGLPLD